MNSAGSIDTVEPNGAATTLRVLTLPCSTRTAGKAALVLAVKIAVLREHAALHRRRKLAQPAK